MNTIWLKIAAVAVAALVALVVVAKFMPSEKSAPEPRAESKSWSEKVTETKSFASQVEEDKEKFAIQPPPQKSAPEPAPQPEVAPEPPRTVPPKPEPVASTKIIHVRPLGEIESIQAEKLLSAASSER